MSDTRAYKDWELFKTNLLKETQTIQEDEAGRLKRIADLKKKGNHEKFFKYYFPNYSYAEPALFHKRASKRVIENQTIYEVRPWSRELAKSARTMMEVIYLGLEGGAKCVLMISATKDSAENLLKPFKLNFEYNQRIINDYGEQKGALDWEDSHFVTRSGVSFFAFGAGQSPRGTRNEEIRPDIIIFDDIDTDEEVRNPARIQAKWDWIEQAVMPTVSVSKEKRIIFLGNIIGKDTCITRAMKFADYVEIVNIRDKDGKSTWPEKNKEDKIDWLLSKMSYRSAQKEYFNNPISEGTVFKQMHYGKVPPLKSFKFLCAYGDPATSNKTSAKKKKNKTVWLVGKHENKYYIITGFLDNVTNYKFLEYYFLINDYVNGATQVHNWIENNSLQDPFFEQVFLPLFTQMCNEKETYFSVRGDTRNKPDKFERMEGRLEPLNSQGNLIINIAEKDNPHVKRLDEQFLLIDEQLSAPADGPDAIEGAIWIIDNKLRSAREVKVKKLKKRNLDVHRKNRPSLRYP